MAQEFAVLWCDYWEHKAVPHPKAHLRPRRWRRVMGLFEETWQVHRLALQEAQLKKKI